MRSGVFVLGLVLAASSIAHASDYAPLLQEFRPFDPPLPLPTFELTERSGAAFRPEELRGKVWVAHFFFTTCPGPCVKTIPSMQRLQKVFAGKPDVALVSITAKSAHDTPEILRDYAKSKGADEAQWLFLTGEEDRVHKVIRECFYKGVERDANPSDPGNDITHSPDLLLIDRDGNIRGYVDGQDPRAVERLIARIRSVAAEKYLLPTINASLNALCAVLLVAGYVAIRARRETLHIACMILALCVSATFLGCYLYYHIVIHHTTAFRGVGWIRGVYFTILLTHTILAATVAPLALYVAYQGMRDRRARHVSVARWTLPVWLYVSVTGVVVYVMLYQLYPPY